MNPRRGYELEGLFFGRPVRPFHLSVTVATGALAIANADFDGPVLTGRFAAWIAVWSVVAVTLLTYGWWARKEWAAEWGLLAAVGVWATRAMFAVLTHPPQGWWFAVLVSSAWVIGAGGAYLLERYDHAMRDE